MTAGDKVRMPARRADGSYPLIGCCRRDFPPADRMPRTQNRTDWATMSGRSQERHNERRRSDNQPLAGAARCAKRPAQKGHDAAHHVHSAMRIRLGTCSTRETKYSSGCLTSINGLPSTSALRTNVLRLAQDPCATPEEA